MGKGTRNSYLGTRNMIIKPDLKHILMTSVKNWPERENRLWIWRCSFVDVLEDFRNVFVVFFIPMSSESQLLLREPCSLWLVCGIPFSMYSLESSATAPKGRYGKIPALPVVVCHSVCRDGRHYLLSHPILDKPASWCMPTLPIH